MQKIAYLFLVFSIFIFSTASLKAQENNSTGKITGKVTDKDNNASIQLAAVKLLNSSDSSLVTGTETDASGNFIIDKIAYGKYSVVVEYIGYSTGIARNITIDENNPSRNLDFKLKAGTTTTDEIVVESEKSAIELKPDRRVFNVENMGVTGGSAIDVLKNVPSVSVDVDGNLTLRGNGNVKIIVDGKPFGLSGTNLSTLLDQIPANQIASIEVISNPGAKFDAEGVSGIINIVMKKNDGVGYNGSVSLNTGTRDKYNGSLNLNVRNKGLNFFGLYDYRLNNFFVEGNGERINFLNPTYYNTIQSSDGTNRNYSHFGKAGFDYNIDDNNSLSLSGSYNDRSRKRSETNPVIQTNMQNVQTGNYVSYLSENGDGYSFSVAGNYMLKFKNPKQTLTSDVNFLRWTDNSYSGTLQIIY